MKNKEIKRVVKKQVRSSSCKFANKILWIGSSLIIALTIICSAVCINDVKRNSAKQKNFLLKENSKLKQDLEVAKKDTSVCKSSIPGWRKDFFEIDSAMATDNWSYFESGIFTEKMSFSMEYPSEWQLTRSGSFFKTSNKKTKVTAIPRNVINLKQGQKCFDKQSLNEFEYLDENGKKQTSLIKEERKVLGEWNVALRIQKQKILNNSFFTYLANYCLEKNNKAILLTFISDNNNDFDTELYEKILSTIKHRK